MAQNPQKQHLFLKTFLIRIRYMRNLNPKAIWFFFLPSFSGLFAIIVMFGIIIIAMLVDSGQDIVVTTAIAYIILAPLILGIPIYIWAKLTYNFYRFDLTDNGLHIERGIIIKKYILIPYDRIQNVDIYRGILARILGLSDINFQTAGSYATEGRLPALSQADAKQLQNELIHKMKRGTNQGL